MSIQTIIDRAQQIEFDRRRLVSQTVSRSQRIKTAERTTAQPWKFKVTPPGVLLWANSRGIVEVITLNDRVNEYQISLNNNSKMNYITAYQGELSNNQLNNLSISSTSTATLILTDLPSITGEVTSSTVLFRPGDIIQPANSRYPYSVQNTVLRGATTQTSVSLHRPFITSEGVNVVGQSVLVGNSCTWRVVVSALPTFKLIPNKQLQFTGDFELVEKVI
jgi:hypothetical protein